MSETASQRSGEASETSSQAADRDILKKRRNNHSNGEEDDLLEQKKSLQEGVFAAMYMLSRSKSADSWLFPAIKITLEGLIPFLVIFNPTNDWAINTSHPAWQIVRWALPRSPVARIWGYEVYVRVFYAIVAVVYITVGCIAILTVAMRRQEHSKALKRFARFLQLVTELVFTLGYMAMFDFMVFLFNCKFISKHGHPHAYWPEVECFATPHLIHISVAGVTAIVFFCSTALMLVAGCDLNPVTTGLMASPAAMTRLRVLVLKALYIIAINTLASVAKVQAVVVVVAVGGITYFNLKRLPFLRPYINFFWVGVWTPVLYTNVIFCIFEFGGGRTDLQYNKWLVNLVLYGVFPSMAAGMLLAFAWYRYRMRPSWRFANLDPAVKLKKVYAFGSTDEVEVLSRNMRQFDIDGIVLEEAALLGENVITCGMAVFPGEVKLLTLYANFLMEVRRDGPAARTQLQLALKASPSMVQRYGIFSTIENSKQLKDGSEGTLDLQSYVEFKRNYRAVIRVHKAALCAQREFWQLMQRGVVRVSAVEATIREMDEKADTANQVYKRVLERYPNNGKLLRCYGKFLEDVRDDPIAATRAYTEAARNGGGDVLLSLDLQVQGADKPEFLTTMDLHEDVCIVINAEGTILMVNSCVTGLLGYAKTELEGANVSMIMPQPFSGRHASYLSRYAQGGEPHILDTVRDVVALHKEHHVFPLQICVTKLSGVGADAIFLGLLRPQPLDARNVRAWVAPNGVILCTDPQFASLTGMTSTEMVGRNFTTLCTDMAAIESLLEVCKEAPYENLVTGTITRDLHLAHRHLPPVPVEIKVTPGGTDSQRIFVFNARRTDGRTEGLMVLDTKGALTFATWDVAAMLGYPMDKFLKMRLEQLLPLPFATMHLKHLRDHSPVVPPTSCRAGRVVHLVNSNGTNVPVRLAVTSMDDQHTGRPKHIVQVHKLDPTAAADQSDRRLVITCRMDGTILSVDQPSSTLFGFTASAAVGTNLADCIDVFSEWRTKAGASQLELLLLSLLDKEAEIPGTSWRVKVNSPGNEDSRLPNIDPKAPSHRTSGRSACMQTELVEDVDPSHHGGVIKVADTVSSLARLVLWRRDLLTGIVELDDQLVVRRADVDTGLIMGLPPSSLTRKPLHKLLDVPKGVSWEAMMRDKRRPAKQKKSALKGASGLVVSPVQAFEGPHPDGGTMKIFLQGVSGGGGGRIHLTMHPDIQFTGAHANIYRALGLESLIEHQNQQHSHHHHHQQQQPRAADDTAQRDGKAAGGSGPAKAGADTRGDGNKAPVTVAPAPAAADASTSPSPASVNPLQPGNPVRRGSQLPRHHPSSEVGGDDAESEWPERDRASEGEPTEGEEGDGEDGSRAGRREASVSSSSDTSSSGDDDGSGREGARADKEGRGARRASAERDERVSAGVADEEIDPEHLHKTAHSQSEFVAQWVRTLAKQMAGVAQDPAADRDALPASRAVSRLPSRAASDGRSPAGAEGGAGGSEEGSGDGAEAGRGLARMASGAPGRRGSGGAGFSMAGRMSGMNRGSRRKLDLSVLAPVPEKSGAESGEDSDSPRATAPAPRSPRSPAAQQPARRRSRFDLKGAGNSDDEDGDGDGGQRPPPRRHHGGDDEDGEIDEGSEGFGSRRIRGGGDGDDLADLADRLEAKMGVGEQLSRGMSGDDDGASSVGDDTASQGGLGPAFTDASSAVDVDLATDARRARLLKRLTKVLSGPHLTVPLARMRLHTIGLLVAMLITHVVVYVIFINLIDEQFSNIREVHRLALAADRCQLVTVKAVLAEFCARPGIAPVSVCEGGLARTLADVRLGIEDLELYHQSTYLGDTSLPHKVPDPSVYYLWTEPTSTYRVFYDTQPVVWTNATTGVWQLGNRFIATARELLYWGEALGGRIADLRAYKFVVANGPWSLFLGYSNSLQYLVKYAWEEVAKLQTALIIMLIVEAAGVQLACLLYELWLVRSVEIMRRGELLAGLGIPGPMLRVLANKPVVIAEDSDEEDADEEDMGAEGAPTGGGGGGGGGATAPQVAAPDDAWAAPSAGPVPVGRSRRMSMEMVPPAPGAPLAPESIPDGVSAGSAGVGYTSQPHSDVSAFSSHLLGGGDRQPGGAVIGGRRGAAGVQRSRGGRVVVNGKELVPSYRNLMKFMVPLVLWEIALVVVGAVSYVRLAGMQGPLASLNMASHVIYRYTRIRTIALLLVAGSTPEERSFYREHLKLEVTNMQSEYDTLMYGGVAITQAGSVFQSEVPASTFESDSFSRNFFREERCFRWDPSQCYTPSSPYYEVTHHGLDVMLRRILSEMSLLASDDDADATYNGTRYTTMYYVGTRDLYEGLQSSAQLFVDFSIARYESIKLLQTILLAVTIAFFLLYALLLVRPYAAAIEREAGRLAGLLSHVPAEMDVVAHVRQILRVHDKLHGRKGPKKAAAGNRADMLHWTSRGKAGSEAGGTAPGSSAGSKPGSRVASRSVSRTGRG